MKIKCHNQQINYKELDEINGRFSEIFRKIFENYAESVDYQFEEACKSDFKELLDCLKNLEVKYIKYSEISLLVYKYEKDEEFINDFISFIISKIDSEEVNQKAKGILFKVISHIELAILQKRYLYKVQKEQIDNLNNSILYANKENENLKESYNELKRKHENIMISFVSILGIFASIIFAVFGGFKQLEGLGNNLHHIAIYKMLMYIGCTGIVITSIVFISFYSVSKLTGLRLHSCGCDSKCECSVYKKYPVLMMTYHFLISMISTGFIILLLRHYYDFGLTNNAWIGGILILIFSILLILPVLIFLYNNFFKSKKEK